MKKKPITFFLILIVIVGALLWWSRSISNVSQGAVWPGTDIQCLQFGHNSLAFHIHPTLAIVVDGQPEAIPANIGISQTCMSEVHTHDTTGTLHIESNTPGRTFTIEDFFTVGGTSLSRNGFSHTVTINGDEVDSAATILNDGDLVVINYVSNGDGQPAAETNTHGEANMDDTSTGVNFDIVP